MAEQTVDINDDLTLKDVVHRFGPRAKVIVKDGEDVVGKVVLTAKPDTDQPPKRMFGMHPGNVLFMAEDFDAPLPDDFGLSGDP
jgi:hypothetical protein